jgi:hypothetical protein
MGKMQNWGLSGSRQVKEVQMGRGGACIDAGKGTFCPTMFGDTNEFI